MRAANSLDAVSEICDRLQPKHQCVCIRAGATGIDHVLDVQSHLQACERPVRIVELHAVFVALDGHRAEVSQILQLFRPRDVAVDVGIGPVPRKRNKRRPLSSTFVQSTTTSNRLLLR